MKYRAWCIALGVSCASFAVPLAGCEPDPCEAVTCGAGSVCGGDGLCHCGSGAGPTCGDAERCVAESAMCTTIPEAVCNAGTRWRAGMPAFTESTAAWALEGVQGVRLAAVDFDSDGWTDLVVRRGGPNSDDFAAGGTRYTWLLRNVQGRFEDVTEASGFLQRRSGSGGRPIEILAFGDIDGDGDLDAYTGLSTADPMVSMDETSEVLLNQGDGTFALGPEDGAIREAGFIDVPAGATFLDYDRDGDLDLFVGQHNYTSGSRTVFRGDRLWDNDGTGRFTDVTAELGLGTRDWVSLDDLDAARAHSRAWATAACDLSDDGYPDILVASYGRAPNHLWRSGSDEFGLLYENHSVASGYDNDDDLGWDDNQFARCFCQANPTAEDCAGVAAPTVGCSPNWNHDTDRHAFRLGGNSGATVCRDLDNDGWPDLVTSEIRHWWAGAGADGADILHHTGTAEALFTRPGRAATGLEIVHAGASWDEGIITAAALDFDLDGWADILLGATDYPGNHALLYHQESALSFAEVPITDGIDHHRAHGIAIADFDRDGDLDIVIGHSRARCGEPDDCYATSQVRFFENVVGDMGGNWAQFRLEGAAANRSAVGARVRVTAGGSTQTQEVEGGHGHYGMQDDFVLTFGLAAACEAEVEVRWPDGALTTQTFSVTSGHRYYVRQGAQVVADDVMSSAP